MFLLLKIKVKVVVTDCKQERGKEQAIGQAHLLHVERLNRAAKIVTETDDKSEMRRHDRRGADIETGEVLLELPTVTGWNVAPEKNAFWSYRAKR